MADNGKRLLAAAWHARLAVNAVSCIYKAVAHWHPERGLWPFSEFPQDQRKNLVAKIVELRDQVRQLRLLLRDDDLRRRLSAANPTPATVGDWTAHSCVEAVHDFGTALLEDAAAAQRIRLLPDGKVRIGADPPGEGIAFESDPPEINSALLMENLMGFLRLAHWGGERFNWQATVVALEKEWERATSLPETALPPLSLSQWLLLETLAAQVAPITLVDLCEATGYKDRKTVGEHVDVLRHFELCGPPAGCKIRETVIYQKGHDILSERKRRAFTR